MLKEASIIVNFDHIVIWFNYLPSCAQTFLNKNSFLALVSICIHFWVRLSSMPNTDVFKLFLGFEYSVLYLANLIMISLNCLPFLSFPVQWLWSISTSVSFSCKSAFKVSVTTTLVSSFSLSFTLSTKMQFSMRVLLMLVNDSVYTSRGKSVCLCLCLSLFLTFCEKFNLCRY